MSIFGTLFALGYQYTADPRWSAILSIGFLSASVPTLEALWGLTLSPFRGLFFASPILLLSLPGLVLLRRSTFRAEWITTLAIALSFFALISASAQWWGGWSAGPRYLVPLLPFLVWPLAATFDRMAQMTSRWRMIAWFVTIGLAVISIANVWALTLGGQYYAPDDIMNPLIDYSWPHILTGDVARNWGMILGLYGAASTRHCVAGRRRLIDGSSHHQRRKRLRFHSCFHRSRRRGHSDEEVPGHLDGRCAASR
jgi:hypothetical protein